MTGMTDLERLLALEDIKLLKARRDRAVDTKDWDTYLALHAPDHESHNDGHGHWKSAEEMITFESPIKAKGMWAMEDNIFWKQGDEEHWLQGFGFYHESYEKRDGKWVFTRRQLKRTHVRTSVGAVTGAKPKA
jgi:hypothetical protein